MKDISVETTSCKRSSLTNCLPQLVEPIEKSDHGNFKKFNKMKRTIPSISMEKLNQLSPYEGITKHSYPTRSRLNTLPQRTLKNATANSRITHMKRSVSQEMPKATATERSLLKDHNQFSYTPSREGKLSIPRFLEPGKETNGKRRSSIVGTTTEAESRRWNRADSLTSTRRLSNGSPEINVIITNNENNRTQARRYGTWTRHNSYDGENDETLFTNPVISDRQNGFLSPSSQTSDGDFTDAVLSKRRWSRPNFATTSRRVSLLLRCKKGLQNSSKKDNTFRDTLVSTDTCELPRHPRFSSFMSPEAQYALMKGYEDKLHDKLSETYPEYDGLLKRNKTPHSHINIRRKSSVGVLGDAEEEDEEFTIATSNFNTDGCTRNANEASDGQKIPDASDQIPARTLPSSLAAATSPNNSLDDSSVRSEPQKATPTAALKNLRRLSLSLVNGGNMSNLFGSDLEGENANDVFSLRRQSSLPSLCSLSSERRIMMSYRLESAMDILDTIRGQNEAPLSPRIKAKPRQYAPLPDYNTWSSDWSREFKMNHGKA